MSYKHVYDMARDGNLAIRIAGCVATQTGYTLPTGTVDHPVSIAEAIQWLCAGQPGWEDAYAYAIATNIEDPGLNEAVITDEMILSAVQLVLGIE
jgi:hypothetical protein